MEITTLQTTDHTVICCVNDYYTLRWYYDYVGNNLVKYKIDSLFFEETGHFMFEYDTNQKPINITGYILKEFDNKNSKFTKVIDIDVSYDGSDIVYYSDQDGNWYDKNIMGGVFPYDDPRYLKKKIESALEDIKANGTTNRHYIVEPDYTRYE